MLFRSVSLNSPGHKYRHILVQNILKSNLPIDIYGNGCKYYNNINDPRIKGEFNDTTLFDNYKFHICIENFQTPHYFSEKIMDPLICNSIPIYLGCNNINPPGKDYCSAEHCKQDRQNRKLYTSK